MILRAEQILVFRGRLGTAGGGDSLSETEVATGDFEAETLVTDGDTTVAVEITARNMDVEELLPMTFLPRDNVVVMDAKHFAEKKDVGKAGFSILESYGKYGSGVKVFPVTESFGSLAVLQNPDLSPEASLPEPVCTRSPSDFGESPCLIYQFLLEQRGIYRIEPSDCSHQFTCAGEGCETSGFCGRCRRDDRGAGKRKFPRGRLQG